MSTALLLDYIVTLQSVYGVCVRVGAYVSFLAKLGWTRDTPVAIETKLSRSNFLF